MTCIMSGSCSERKLLILHLYFSHLVSKNEVVVSGDSVSFLKKRKKPYGVRREKKPGSLVDLEE